MSSTLLGTLPANAGLCALVTVTKKTSPTAASTAGSGLTVQVWLSDTVDGPAIDPSLDVTAPEQAPAGSGTYLATWTRAALAPFIPPRVGRDLYIVADDGSTFQTSGRYQVVRA